VTRTTEFKHELSDVLFTEDVSAPKVIEAPNKMAKMILNHESGRIRKKVLNSTLNQYNWFPAGILTGELPLAAHKSRTHRLSHPAQCANMPRQREESR
jgi:hypothetical protein